MYEAVNEVYKVLIPIHEANRDAIFVLYDVNSTALLLIHYTILFTYFRTRWKSNCGTFSKWAHNTAVLLLHENQIVFTVVIHHCVLNQYVFVLHMFKVKVTTQSNCQTKEVFIKNV